jgi:hypothetical protein
MVFLGTRRTRRDKELDEHWDEIIRHNRGRWQK